MNRRTYILNGNYQMLDDLYAEKAALEKKLADATRYINAQSKALSRAKSLLSNISWNEEYFRSQNPENHEMGQ